MQHFHGLAAAEWNRELFGSLCTDLVPDHLVDLKNEFAGNDADSLYRFWPSAKRAKPPFSVLLPGQVRRVVGRGGVIPCSLRCFLGKGRVLVLNVNVIAIKEIVLIPARLGLILMDCYGHAFVQMYQRLGELPLYLSRSYEGESFMTMKEGFFKT